MASSNFTYGAGNPKGAPTVAKPVAPKPTTSSKSTVDKSILNTLSGLSQSLGTLGGVVEKLGSTGSAPVTPTTSTTTAEELARQQALKDARDAAAIQAEKERQGTSAYSLLLAEFNKYGLGALVSPLQDLIKQGLSAGEFSLALQNTDAYKKRFAANTDRIAKGLTALSPAEYIGLEDQYQNIMRNYGLPASYYTKGDLGIQEGFNKLLANDVSALELEDRVATAQNRVVNANPQVKEALKKFYPDITDSDILAYSLDPAKALTDIKRKVTAAEIGGAALGQGLATSQLAAEGLASYGITKQQAEQGYGQIADLLPTTQKLASIYKDQPYTQQQAESEIFNLSNSAEAAKKRKKLAATEQATFSGSAGLSSGALNRDRALNNQSYGSGAY